MADPPNVRIELMSTIFSHWMGVGAKGAVAVADDAIAEGAAGSGLLAPAVGLSIWRGGLEGGAAKSSQGEGGWERTGDDGERGGEQSFHSGGAAASSDDEVFVGRLDGGNCSWSLVRQVPASSSRSSASWHLITARASYVGARCLAIFAIETGSSHVSEAFLPLLLAVARLRLAGGGG